MKIGIEYRKWCGDVALYLYEQSGDRIRVAKPVMFELGEYQNGATTFEPTMAFPRMHGDEFLKSLAEEIAKIGIRPDFEIRREAGLEGKLKATERHLQDFRRLVFRKEK